MAKGVLVLFLMIMLAGSVLGAQSLGVFQTGQNITLQQSCSGSTYSNISKVIHPDSTAAINTETVMTSDGGSTYSYVFNDTEPLGQYLVYGHCDEDGEDTVWVYDFEVTYSGQKVSLSNSMIIFALMGLAAIFLTISFFFKEDYWMLKAFFQFLSVLAGLISVNSARIIASESNSLGTMGEMGILLMIVVLAIFFLWIFVRAFKEIIKIFKEKGDLRWNYD
ncbi:hypothetical protein LCGC14_0442300 [marine sediment metagenome]|uniref:Uncharacterized protein n=1 Tax=marine sediment metagenome TaxID=412755 RepID=A0A0F9SK44_9ZZZZ